jgi:ABC-type iron transport system FetAB ATPase subunit
MVKRFWAALLAIVVMGIGSACKRSIDNQEAVRQAVIDYLSKRSNLNVSAMNVDVASVTFRSNEADAVVAITARGAAPGQPMSMRYTLERQGDHWIISQRRTGASCSAARSFARALIADPRILVLDEATSNVDLHTEGRIEAGLRRLLAGRTAIVIAHRLSTIRRADQILVVEQGRILERGNHAQLYARQGRYYEMYTRQHGLEMNLFLAPGEGDRVEEPEVVAAPAPARRTGLLGE